MFGDPTFLVIAPLLWFYVVELTGENVRLNAIFLSHFVPFSAIILSSISLSTFLSDTRISQSLDAHPTVPFIIFWTIIVVQFAAYQFAIRKKWRAHLKIIQNELSSTEDANIAWVRYFNVVFLVINLSFLIGLLATIHLDILNWIWKSVSMVLSFSIIALGYKGILQKEIFFPELTSDPRPIEQPIASETHSDAQALEKVRLYMQNEKPFLDSELSLNSLSKAMGMNRNELSQLINSAAGENFYDFVNQYRVEEVQQLMADPQKEKYSLFGIALEAGFKSKSGFNLIFKRFTGTTPTDYKKKYINKDVH